MRMCHELEQPRLFVATLTPLFNKTLGLGQVGITNKNSSYPLAVLQVVSVSD